MKEFAPEGSEGLCFTVLQHVHQLALATACTFFTRFVRRLSPYFFVATCNRHPLFTPVAHPTFPVHSLFFIPWSFVFSPRLVHSGPPATHFGCLLTWRMWHYSNANEFLFITRIAQMSCLTLLLCLISNWPQSNWYLLKRNRIVFLNLES